MRKLCIIQNTMFASQSKTSVLKAVGSASGFICIHSM